MTRSRVFGLSLLLMTVPTLGFASKLSDLAATVEPGTFVELKINGPVSTCQAMVPPLPLKDPRNGDDIPRRSFLGNILQFTDEALWDPIGRDIYIMGTRRPYKPWDQGFVKYSVDTNSWTILNLPPFGVGAHGYDNGALDVQGRTYYWSRIGQSRIVWSMNLDTGIWTQLPNAPIQSGQFSALEFSPELDRLVFFDGLIETSGGQPTGNASEYALYNPNTGQWESPVALPDAPFGSISHFSEHNPTHNVLFFGGGHHYTAGGTIPDPTPNVTESRRLYMLDSEKVVTRLADAPTGLGQSGSGPVQTIDPNTGKLIVFQGRPNNGSSPCTNPLPIWEYDLPTNAWTQTGTHQLTSLYCSMDTVAVPLYDYGVNFIVSVRGDTNCRVFLYRHSAAEAESASALAQDEKEVQQIVGPRKRKAMQREIARQRNKLVLLEKEVRQTVGPRKKKAIQREIARERKKLALQQEKMGQNN